MNPTKSYHLIWKARFCWKTKKFEMEIFPCVFVSKIKIEIHAKLADIRYANRLLKPHKTRYNASIKSAKITAILSTVQRFTYSNIIFRRHPYIWVLYITFLFWNLLWWVFPSEKNAYLLFHNSSFIERL